jgi:hypothetical protein
MLLSAQFDSLSGARSSLSPSHQTLAKVERNRLMAELRCSTLKSLLSRMIIGCRRRDEWRYQRASMNLSISNDALTAGNNSQELITIRPITIDCNPRRHTLHCRLNNSIWLVEWTQDLNIGRRCCMPVKKKFQSLLSQVSPAAQMPVKKTAPSPPMIERFFFYAGERRHKINIYVIRRKM